MLFSEYARYQYVRSPLVEFQEAVRHGFPRYAARKEQLPPR